MPKHVSIRVEWKSIHPDRLQVLGPVISRLTLHLWIRFVTYNNGIEFHSHVLTFRDRSCSLPVWLASYTLCVRKYSTRYYNLSEYLHDNQNTNNSETILQPAYICGSNECRLKSESDLNLNQIKYKFIKEKNIWQPFCIIETIKNRDFIGNDYLNANKEESTMQHRSFYDPNVCSAKNEPDLDGKLTYYQLINFNY